MRVVLLTKTIVHCLLKYKQPLRGSLPMNKVTKLMGSVNVSLICSMKLLI